MPKAVQDIFEATHQIDWRFIVVFWSPFRNQLISYKMLFGIPRNRSKSETFNGIDANGENMAIKDGLLIRSQYIINN